MKFKPHHIAFTVKNLQQTINWYENNLGFKVLTEYEKKGVKKALLQLDEVLIELFDNGENTKLLPNYRKTVADDLQVIGTKHIGIEVEDLYELVKSLQKKGVEVQEIKPVSFGGICTFITDCNGILIELYQK